MSNFTSTDGSALPSGVTTSTDLSSSLSILLVGTVGSSFLVPISAVLLYFQTPRAHRSASFLMILSSLVLGLGEGGLNMYNQISAIRHTAVPSAVTTTYTMVHLFLPLLTESVLVFRVTAMHPPKRLSRFWRALIYVPIFIFKILRIIVLVAIAISWVENSKGLPAPVQGGLDALTAINKLPSQLRWALQVADTLFMSIMFFPRSGSKAKKHPKHPKGGRGPLPESHHTQDTALEEEEEPLPLWPRLKLLFWKAVASFVFPVLLNMIQFVLVLVQNGVLQFPSLFAVNNQAGIIGMVFATVLTPAAAVTRPATRKAATAHARAPTRPGIMTMLSDVSSKYDKEDGSVDSPAQGLPELLSDDRQTAPANWMKGGHSHAVRDDEGDLTTGFGGLLDITGRESPSGGGGGDMGDFGGVFGSVVGALGGGTDGALGHVGHSLGNVGHNLGHVSGWRDLAHGLTGEVREKVHDIEEGVIREERRAVAAVKGKAKSVVDGVKDMVHEVQDAKDQARDAVRGAKDQARGAVRGVKDQVLQEVRDAEKQAKGQARAAVDDLEYRARTAVDDVQHQARAAVDDAEIQARTAVNDAEQQARQQARDALDDAQQQARAAMDGVENKALHEARGVAARVADEEMRVRDRAREEIGTVEARARDEERRIEDKALSAVRVEEARVRDYEIEEGKAAEEIRVEEARVDEEMDVKERFDML